MNKTIASLTVGALALFGAQAVLAQSPTRAEVKAETAAANKAGTIPGTGSSNVPQQAAGAESPKEKAMTSDTTRADRKAKTAEANKAGAIPGTGVSNIPQAAGAVESPKDKAMTSDTTRAQRKADTAAANKAGEIKSGEANITEKKK